MALRALQRSVRKISHVSVLTDPAIDDETEERSGIAAAVSVADLRLADLRRSRLRSDCLHVLLHGVFDQWEPLLSSLRAPNAAANPIRAADVLAWPIAGLPLVVLSACEGGRTISRVSNEIYGFPWALLAGGATAAVVSRWRMSGETNSLWMRAFYEALAGAMAPSAAAAAAMRNLHINGFSHPFYWAAMQVIGR